MKAPYFIETLARNGDVLHRHQVAGLPIRLGRGYDNDFILDDAHAAPAHAVIEGGADGRLLLRDLGTKNGVVYRGKRHGSIELTGDTVIRMGHTSLRVRGADFPVPPELVDRTMHGWEGALPGLAGMLLIGIVALLTVWLGDTRPFQLSRYLQALAYGVAAGLVWGGMWAFANRLFGRHARLGRHLFIFGCGLAALAVYKIVSSMAAYAWSLEWLVRYGMHVAIALMAGMVYFHLGTVRPQRRRYFASSCALLALLGSGLTLVGNLQASGRVADQLYMPLLLPPEMRASPDRSVDEFMAEAAAMKVRIDAERLKHVEEERAAGE
ncbi:FHA domain-containing protein [Massilia sp. GCM10020059]|uniref:FHA domain-containing protein n=1 Tax=Massilia agrisoli TaxID=2892444 RepID=A0ABS8ITM5_9BURK|nr:FHA domain-containing protein [Massilia agrisoli]MCC6071790.1 FHA domain-containing protein [Massilia agrisoli]